MKRACIECGAISDKWRCEKHRRFIQSRTPANRPRRNGSTRTWRKTRERVLERDGHRCVECGSADGLTVDHVVAREYGGTDDDHNLITRCTACHAERHGAAPRSTHVAHGDAKTVYALVPPQQLIALCGPPGSGKTSLTQLLTIPSVSADDYRHGDFTRTGTRKAFAIAYEKASEILRRGESVIFDSTAVTSRSRASLRSLGRSHHVATSLVVMECSLKELLERNKQRAVAVPEFTIAQMYEDYQLAKDTIEHEGFRTVLYLKGGTQNL